MTGELRPPEGAQPQTDINAPIVVAGHSHMSALVGDLHASETELHAVPNFPNVLALHAPWPRSEEYWEHLRAKSAGTRIALVWNGNEHNLHYFFQSPHPFDFQSRHVSKIISTFRIIPRRMVREKFNKSSFDDLRAVLVNLATGSARSIHLVGTPPPKKDNEQLRKILLNEPHFTIWAEGIGESFDTVKITSPHLRLKLWFLVQEMLAEAAHEVGGKFVSVPAELQDADGFLRSEYWASDVTHANRLYGEVMLRRIVQELS